MALPNEIPVQYNEEVAGYMSVQPVVKQTFRLHELADMVVSVTGKDAGRVEQIFRTGSIVYNGYRYRWSPLAPEQNEIDHLLAAFPNDEPDRPFQPENATAALLEIGGGTQRTIIEITQEEASSRKLFAKQSPWNALLAFVTGRMPRYEQYSHARRADLYRLSLPYDQAQTLLIAMLEAAPRGLRQQWSTLHPPAAVAFVCPRK